MKNLQFIIYNKGNYQEVYDNLSSKMAGYLGIDKPLFPPFDLWNEIRGYVGVSGCIGDTGISLETTKFGFFKKKTLVEISGVSKDIKDNIVKIVNDYTSSNKYKLKTKSANNWGEK